MNTKVIAAGYAAFISAAILPHLLSRAGLSAFFESHPTAPHFFVKTALVIFAIAAIRFSRKPWLQYGFARPAAVRWFRAIGIGALLGAGATLFILFTPAKGMPNLRNFGVLGLIFSIWFYSSIAEELFVRGWLQSSLDTSEGARVSPVLVSGLFFGSIHLTLVPTGADWITVVVIVTATTLLGFHTAQLREKHGSLLPPLVAHIAFNVGGFIAGIIINIITIARTGAPITP